MTDLLSSFAVNEILKLVQSAVTDAITKAWGLKDDLEKLSDSIWMLQSLLQKFQYVPAVEDDQNIKPWLEKLQKVVYAAADVVDEFHYEILRRKVEIKNQLNRKVRDFVSCNNPIIFRVNMAAKVKEVCESLANLEKQAPLVLLQIPEINVAAGRGVVLAGNPERQTDSFLGESERPIGRREEVERIIEMLQVSSAVEPCLSVISIVGFGGLGKTTLAQLVCQEAKKKKLFDETMWVCVSELFDISKILGDMIEKLDKTTGGLRNMDAIVGNLQQQLKDKRFLLVLDDVWNKEREKWDKLKRRLEIISGKSGNFVLVTTRSREVSSIMGSKYVEEIKQLLEEECWSIIKERVFGNGGESTIPHDLEIIGMEIANKCGGVPLAAKVVGGVLRTRLNKDEWSSIRGSINVWNEVDKDESILNVLKLSFDHLPQPQKLCFAYCSLFPKDVVIDKAQLIQLWMAEDFLKTTLTNGGTSAKLMEDVGEEYFRGLLVSSFFQDVQVDDFGNIVGCKMHDLLHDLASSISKSQRLQCGSDCIKTSDGRSLNCSCDQDSEVKYILEKFEDARNLRSLFCRVDVSAMLSNFRRLRILDMSDAKLKNVPDAIRKLKHLRYLDISYNENLEELPESITKLYNLQTLRVFACNSLKELSSKISNLVTLRHMVFDDKRLVPLKVGCLTNLQTLSFFVVGSQKGQMIDELEGLNELRGELVVCGLENVRNKGEAERVKLKEKKLSKLGLQWMKLEEDEVKEFSSSREGSHEEVMEGLGAPKNIRSLTVKWYMCKQFPEWISQLSELVKLTLKNCRRCQTMPTLGHLPKLKVLTVERMDGMKFIGSEFYGQINNADTLFPLLEEFSISEMKSLVEWVTPEGTEIFPKLRELRIVDCPKLTSFSLSQSTSSAIHMQLGRIVKGSNLTSFSLSESTPSAIHMQLGCSSAEIWCNLDFKSLEDLWIRDCPKLRFLYIGLTSLLDFCLDSRQVFSGQQQEDDIFTNLSICSNELGGSWKTVRLEGPAEMIREFPKSLESLEVWKFNDKLSVEAFYELSCLKHLVILSCDGLELIPSLSSLTSLELLKIDHCHLIVSIPSLSSLSSLKHLEITYCNRLETIPTLSSLTSLEHLEINNCYRLESMPTISSLTRLKVLLIRYCHNFSSLPSGLVSCQSLKKLFIVSCGKLSELPPNAFSTLIFLEKLYIWHCYNLRSLPGEIRLCTSLKELVVESCVEMVSFDDDMIGFLTQLKKLTWGSFSQELDKVPCLNSIHLLTSLEELTIYGWNKLTSLPHQLQRLTSITELVIGDFDGVESLPDWLCNLSSLQILSVEFCKNLKNLPADLQRLSKLTRLWISSCPLLEERCTKDIGPEWSNISHIPYIRIAYEDIQDLRSPTNSGISI